MSTIFPVQQTFQLVYKNGFYTPAFKIYLDEVLARMGGIKGGIYTQLTDQAVLSWDLDKAPVCVVVLGDNRTLADPTNMIAGYLWPYSITFVKDGTGNRTITGGGSYKFPGGVAPVLSTAPNATDEFVFDSDGTNMKLIASAKGLA